MDVIRDDEITLLLTDVHEVYGYDFTAYAKASMKRRINHALPIRST